MRYPIVIEQGTDTAAFGVVVPDLPGCFSAGDTLDEAIDNAKEAAAAWIDAAMDKVWKFRRLQASKRFALLRITLVGPLGSLISRTSCYRSRVQFQEACALRALAGELVPIEDLVLVDAGASVRLSTIELTRARNILGAQRAAAAKPAAWASSDEALFDDRLDVERDELLYQLGEEEWDEG
jgi:predicted RNase H-like HicB family nuclease